MADEKKVFLNQKDDATNHKQRYLQKRQESPDFSFFES